MKYLGIDLVIGGQSVDIETFKLYEGTHYKREGDRVMLLIPFEVHLYWEDKEGVGRVSSSKRPYGFWSDGASIPKCVRWLIGNPLDVQFLLAAFAHDMATIDNLPHFPESQILYRILKSRKGKMDLPHWKEEVMYNSVYLWSIFT